ncbi:MAG: FISUMP domain-containing protein [Bacteroidia bacterium]
MKNTILIFTLLVMSSFSYGQTKQPIKKPTTTVKPVATKFGALAIDRSNGFYYGWTADSPSQLEAEKNAIEECKKLGGNCTIVLSFSGTGCAAYRTIEGKAGTAFGWGLAKTKEEADVIATKECLKRSNGKKPTNFVWSCNSANTGALKEIYNASSEIVFSKKIGTQEWKTQNLDVSNFRNGDPIPEAQTNQEWYAAQAAGKPAWSYCDTDPKNYGAYGKIYNWYAVNDPRGLAPEGWHIPKNEEWTTLINYLGGDNGAGTKMKTKEGWPGSGNGTNESGFSGLPCGFRYYNGKFDYSGVGFWWSSNPFETAGAMYINVSSAAGNVISNHADRGTGGSVRCVKD